MPDEDHPRTFSPWHKPANVKGLSHFLSPYQPSID